MPGSRRFEPIKRLGGGEYCEVHLCRDGIAGPVVTVKWFRLKHRKVERQIKKGKIDFATDLRAAFLDEIALTAQFNHPTIVRVLDTGGLGGADIPHSPRGPTDDTPWFTMPFHPTDLAHELWGQSVPKSLGKPIPADHVQSLLAQTLDGLKEIHAHGIIHRDIKPQNVLLDADGNAVICDFGHALNPAARAPLGKNRYGTAPFVAPEQREAPDNVDGRADIYSLGVLIYLLLTGRRPNPITAMPRPAHEVDAAIPRDLSDWAQAAMSLVPAARPVSL